MHGVADQFVQAKAFAVRHLLGRLQRSQLEQLLRQAPYLVALVEGCGQLARAPGRRRIAGQCFEMAVQSGKRRSQIMRHTGHFLTMRLCLRGFADAGFF